MTINMNISIQNLQKKVPVPSKKIIQTIHIVVGAIRRIARTYTDISIVFVGPQRMRRMNREYLGHDDPTDVLAFDYKDMSFPRKRESRTSGSPINTFGDDKLFGEIVICPSMAQINAKKYQTTTEHELLLYVIHGLLHLAGYDDHKSQDMARMRRKEAELLKNIVVPVPPWRDYREPRTCKH